jgi:hypothetical protein
MWAYGSAMSAIWQPLLTLWRRATPKVGSAVTTNRALCQSRVQLFDRRREIHRPRCERPVNRRPESDLRMMPRFPVILQMVLSF